MVLGDMAMTMRGVNGGVVQDHGRDGIPAMTLVRGHFPVAIAFFACCRMPIIYTRRVVLSVSELSSHNGEM